MKNVKYPQIPPKTRGFNRNQSLYRNSPYSLLPTPYSLDLSGKARQIPVYPGSTEQILPEHKNPVLTGRTGLKEGVTYLV